VARWSSSIENATLAIFKERFDGSEKPSHRAVSSPAQVLVRETGTAGSVLEASSKQALIWIANKKTLAMG
jgi:hypothetical protein